MESFSEKLQAQENERFLVVLKPDGVNENVRNEVFRRFNESGFLVVAMRQMKATKEFIGYHYPDKENFLRAIGNKRINSAEKHGKYITEDPLEIGKELRKSVIDSMVTGPIIAMVVIGSIERMKNLVGKTDPSEAGEGTIRGDLSEDSLWDSAERGEGVKNVIHVSDPESAADEITHWFGEEYNTP